MSNLPGKPNSDYPLFLKDGQNKYGLAIEDFEVTTMAEDRFAITLRNVGKQIGDFDEQRSWTGGMAKEYLSDNPEGFFDSQGAWTLSNGHAMNGLQWRLAENLRTQTNFLMKPGSGSVAWKSLVGVDRYISSVFTPSANIDVVHIQAWVRKRGNPGTLTAAIYADALGQPDTAIVTQTVTTATITDSVSVLYDFVIAAESLTGGTTYDFVIYGASGDTPASCWEVACNAAASGYKSSDGSSWTLTSHAPYFRVTDADTARRFYYFIYKGALYSVSRYDNNSTASKLYLNGVRGKATAGDSTTLTDSNLSMTADQYIGAWIKIIAGTGVGQEQAITDNTATVFTVAAWQNGVSPDNTSEYIVYSTPYWNECATTGLGVVTGKPVVSNAVVYFPQGEADPVRKMQLNYATSGYHDYADDGTNYATLLHVFTDPTAGLQVWRANISATATTVSRASAVAYASNLTYGTAVTVGSSNYTITNLTDFNNLLYVFKEDSVWSISSDRATKYNYGLESAPDKANGVAAIGNQNFLFFSWLASDQQLYGGQVNDIGLGWRNAALPDGREGYTSDYQSAVAWLIKSIDAGTGTSSVAIFDGINWHEIVRGWKAGKRIRAIQWQPCPGTRSRLWIDIGGEMIYVDFPLKKPNPLYDSGVNFQHEAVIVSSTIDMGTGTRLPKYIKELTAIVKNLSDTGDEIYVDWQADDDIGTSTWYNAGSFVVSPEQSLPLNLGDIRQFRYRLRINTSDVNTPIDVQGVVPNGFGRIPFRNLYNLRCKAGFEYTPTGKKAISPDELLAWIRKIAQFPGKVMTESIYNQLDELSVIVSPPQVYISSPEFLDQNWKGTITISLMEL